MQPHLHRHCAHCSWNWPHRHLVAVDLVEERLARGARPLRVECKAEVVQLLRLDLCIQPPPHSAGWNGFVHGYTLRTPSRIRPPAPSRGASALGCARLHCAHTTRRARREGRQARRPRRGAERRRGRRGPERTSAVVLVDLLEHSSEGLSALGRQARHIVEQIELRGKVAVGRVLRLLQEQVDELILRHLRVASCKLRARTSTREDMRSSTLGAHVRASGVLSVRLPARLSLPPQAHCLRFA